MISEFFYGGGKTTGAAGALMAAKSVCDANPGCMVRFEVAEVRRVLDLVCYRTLAVLTDATELDELALILEVEVKSLPALPEISAEMRAKLITQMRKDLARHIRGSDPLLVQLAWLLDPTGYANFGNDFEDMFIEAFALGADGFARDGFNLQVLQVAFYDALDSGRLINFYQTP